MAAASASTSTSASASLPVHNLQIPSSSRGTADQVLAAGDVAGTHKRTYQACIPCRRRKVRCDLGPVDDPHEPPCVRCRRESKDCYFTATRRKRKAEIADDEPGEAVSHNYSSTLGSGRRKGLRAYHAIGDLSAISQRDQPSIRSGSSSAIDDSNFAQQPCFGQPLQRTSQSTVSEGEDGEDQEVTNETAAALFQSPINTPGDALHLLLRASGQSEEIQRRNTSYQERGLEGAKSQLKATVGDGPPSFTHRSQGRYRHNDCLVDIDPAIADNTLDPVHLSSSKIALQIWSRLRFVRAGWFTAREAISYIDYFYKYIEPLTPVSTPDFRNVHASPDLLSEEPILTVTILTIASRYMRLAGAGSQTRSYMIHERLWQYLQNLVTRMFWGQEQFGGGFRDAGQNRRPKGTEKGRLRTLGTIESLLLLSDYHPRSMHFPPNDDDEDLLAPAEETLIPPSSSDNEQMPGSAGDSAFIGWTEPALRSDRMSWSLIGLSYALAYELGVFGTYSDGMQSGNGIVKRPNGMYSHSKRADKVERLLYIYVTQACGRFGFPSPYPDHVNKAHMTNMKERFDSANSTVVYQSPEDEIQQYWAEVAVINKACNDTLFPSKDLTAQFIQNGEYIGKLQQLQPLLQAWQKSFDSSTVSKYPRLALSIEFQYFRIYINGLALQAVLENWTSKIGANVQSDSPNQPGSTTPSSFATLYSQNEYYIKQVVDAARTVLRHVVDGLLPNDYLKHASVRIYFRIVSAAMFLLKTFALGAKEEEVKISLGLLDDTITSLRTSVVDDVHLCLRIADLLESLTMNIRHKFVRLPPQMTNSPKQVRTNKSSQAPGTKARHARNVADPSLSFAGQDAGYNNIQDPLAGIPATHTNPYDANITIMPPPAGSYTPFNYDPSATQQQQQQQQHQHQQQMYPRDASSSSEQPPDPYALKDGLPFPSEEDWLTLDLNPLLDGNGLSGGDTQWFGAFGPETHNNLEVLGKLVNEGQWQPGDLGFQ